MPILASHPLTTTKHHGTVPNLPSDHTQHVKMSSKAVAKAASGVVSLSKVSIYRLRYASDSIATLVHHRTPKTKSLDKHPSAYLRKPTPFANHNFTRRNKLSSPRASGRPSAAS